MAVTSAPLRQRLDFQRFFQGEEPIDGPMTLTHRRIFIVPNRRGLMFWLLLLVQWLAAINYGNNLAFILTFLLLAIILLAMIYGYRNLSRLRLTTRKNPPVFAGEMASFELLIENLTSLPRFSLGFKGKDIETVRMDIPGDERIIVTLKLNTQRRGWLDPGTITAHTEFPLGVFYAWSPLKFK